MRKLFDEVSVYANPSARLSENSKGRLRELQNDGYRTPFQRDVHRILYSQPFRRLKHKTQVFFMPDNDHICTRMEHALHVASASMTVARYLKLNEDLAEAISLAHDLGHAPFGHHGEKVLNEIIQGFDPDRSFQHEIHGLRVVDMLAELDREPRAGLNLMWDVRCGIISHCGESSEREIIPRDFDGKLEDISDRRKAWPDSFEAAIVRMIDRITYAGRDVEDALAAGLIKEDDIPRDVKKVLGKNNGEIIGTLLEDIIEFWEANPTKIGLSEEKHALLCVLIDFNYERIYKHKRVEKYKDQARKALEEIFHRLLKDLKNTERLRNRGNLPEVLVYKVLDDFIKKIGYKDTDSDEQIVLDFVAGMTDNFVVRSLDSIFVPKPVV